MKNVLKFIGILFILTYLCIYFYKDAYLTTLIHIHNPEEVYTTFSESPLTSNSIIHGQIKAQYDNFGSISLYVHTFGRTNFDAIIFKLREAGQNEWMVTNEYYTDRFPDGALYPFGFPIIENSKGKIYEFNITSVSGTDNRSIGFLRGSRTVISTYSFPKKDILLNPFSVVKFFYLKVITSLTDIWTVLYLSMFLIPLVYLFIRRYKIINKKLRKVICKSFILYLVLIYILNPLNLDSNIILYIIGITLWISLSARIESKYHFILALLVLLMVPVFLANGLNSYASKASIFVFAAFTIGIFLLILRDFYKRNRFLNIMKF